MVGTKQEPSNKIAVPMTNQNDQNETIGRFRSPVNCPVCGRITYGQVCCRGCGLYFFRYYEKKKVDQEERYTGYNMLSVNKKFYNIIFIFFLMAASVLAIWSITNIDVSGDYFGEEIKVKDLSKEIAAGTEPYRTAENNREIAENPNDSKNLPRDILTLYNGRESFYEGVSLYEQQRYPEAADKFKQALIFLKKSMHNESIALTNLNLAVCYYNAKNYNDALSYFENALYLSHKSGFSKMELRAIQGKSLTVKKLGPTSG